jgi:DNA-binding transcriptional regulator YhcF (GntR family)
VTHAGLYHSNLVGPKNPTQVKDIVETADFLETMFRNEFIPIKHNIGIETGVLKMLNYAEKQGIVKKVEGTGYIITEDKKGLYKIEFCKNLMQSYIDSYHIVAQSIYNLMQLSIVIDQKDLVKYLHESISVLYQKGAVRFINSCLTEILEVAFGRFSELGICT